MRAWAFLLPLALLAATVDAAEHFVRAEGSQSSGGKSENPICPALLWLAILTSPDPARQYAEAAAAFGDPSVAEELILEGGEPIVAFEREKLLPFYNRVATAIREADTNHLCFIEPTAAGGAFRTGLARPLAPSGKAHANIVFAPHYYEVATELGLPYEKNRERLRGLIGRVVKTAGALEMPLWFGEWGNVSARVADSRDCVRDCLDAFNEHAASWCYWEYGRDFASLPFLDLLTLPYPTAIAGRPLRLRVSPHELELDVGPPIAEAETIIWLPREAKPTVGLRTREGGVAAWRRRQDGALAITCPRGTTGLSVKLSY